MEVLCAKTQLINNKIVNEQKWLINNEAVVFIIVFYKRLVVAKRL